MKKNPVLEPQEESQAQEPALEDELRPIEAAKHVARAKHTLTCLRHKIGAPQNYPELEQAIADLQIALNILTDETGGML
jgi:hypothetical protein